MPLQGWHTRHCATPARSEWVYRSESKRIGGAVQGAEKRIESILIPVLKHYLKHGSFKPAQSLSRERHSVLALLDLKCKEYTEIWFLLSGMCLGFNLMEH